MTAEPTYQTNDSSQAGEHSDDRHDRNTRTDSHDESDRYTPRSASRLSGLKLPEIDFEAFQSSLYEQINTLHEQLVEMRATQEAHLAELMNMQSEQREALNSMFGSAGQSAEIPEAGEQEAEQDDG
ncbi:hypothetical protein [Vibrio quintilis]|uniref:Uncharacterized protein n=1 Tax=Vibrio quintilis TaxID=1117707 RepID=A0A1M7YVK2_9VIBR|nr:hypothetical protein [Vibrio quintilis]SHO56635.1 hypothetical protein VQ7734_02404 [Vibrio quintilis]